MRILHVDSAATWRGGQNQVLLTARGMARLGHEAAVACQAGGALEARAREAGLAVHPLRFHGDLSPFAVLGLRRLVRRLRPEAVVLHDPHALSAGWLSGSAAGTRVAVRRVDFALRGALSRRKYGSCGRVIAVSEAIAAVLEAGGVPRDRVRVVHEGVPDRPAAPGGREALRRLGIPDGAPVVGNVAALTDHKDHATLLEAAARLRGRLPEARTLIVGEGELLPALRSQAARLGVQDRVVFAGFRRDLDALIPAFDVFCLSSHHEGLGTSLLDAMCFARPIVATRAGGIPEAVADGLTGRVVPQRDPEALASALADVLSDAAGRDAMGRAGRERYLARFTDERMVGATLGALRGA